MSEVSVYIAVIIAGFFTGVGNNISKVFVDLWIEPKIKSLKRKYPNLNIVKIIWKSIITK